VNVHPALRYTALRIALFLGVLLVLALLGVRDLLLLGLAVLISGLASYSLLSRQRDAMSAAVSGRIDRIRNSIDESAKAEDAAIDAALAREAARHKPTEDKP
jgi:Protein of unknown function (DUF4229)